MSIKSLFLATAFTLGTIGAASAQISLKLGVLNDRSGVYADLSGEGSVIAAQMAVEDFKAKQKGLDVTIISADHQNKPDVGSNIARQWYDREGVDTILDATTSSVALAVSQITREKNKVLIVSGAGAIELTGKQCSPNTVHWTYDTYALGNGTGKAVVKQGGDTWYFLVADYAFGHALANDTAAVVEKAGGKVLGRVSHPFPGGDFSSFLLQAQASGAKVIGLANGGGDTINAIKQASEFGIVDGGQTLAGLLVFISDIHALGLKTAHGLVLTEAFYWDQNEGTRAWAKRFSERHGGNKPTAVHAGVYSGTLHYLKAVEALKSKDTAAIMKWMRENPSEDPLFGKGEVRIDGRHVHDMYLFQVKKPEDSKEPWDYYKQLAVIPGAEAFHPLEGSSCELVNKN